MPTRPWAHRISVAGLVGPTRRRVASTLSTGLTLPVLLLGLAATSGCRTDSAATRLPSLNPTRWFERDAAIDESAVDDGFDLQPVPEGGPSAPPLPLEPKRNAYAPAPPPLPDPVSYDEEDGEGFYGVRPTGAEVEEPREPSWTNRFRTLFQKEGSPAAEAVLPLKIRQKPRPAESIERPPVPPGAQASRRASVRLGIPQFENFGEEPVTNGAVEPASQVEPVRRQAVASAEPLPTIVPARKSARPAGTQFASEPRAWPYTVAEQPTLASTVAPVPLPVEPEPQLLETDALAPLPILPQTAEGPTGPALLR